MIELARIQNKYLTQENILLKEHIVALKGIIRKLEDLLRSMCDYPSSPPSSPAKEIFQLADNALECDNMLLQQNIFTCEILVLYTI